MRFAWLIDVVGWAVILIWLWLSGRFAWSGNAEWFQAIGVVGIAGAVGYFVLQRHATPHPFGALESQGLLYKQVLLTSDATARALAYNAILAKAIELDANKRGLAVSQDVSILASTPVEQIECQLSGVLPNVQSDLNNLAIAQLDANAKVQAQRRASEFLQAIVVILGTLQSGLGGLLLTAVNQGAN